MRNGPPGAKFWCRFGGCPWNWNRLNAHHTCWQCYFVRWERIYDGLWNDEDVFLINQIPWDKFRCTKHGIFGGRRWFWANSPTSSVVHVYENCAAVRTFLLPVPRLIKEQTNKQDHMAFIFFSTRVRFVFCITPLKLPGARFKKKCRGPLLVVYFTVKLWLPQMLPNFGYGHQIMPTDVKKQGLPQMSANRPNIWSTGFYIFLMSWFDVYVWIALVQRQKLRRVQDV